MIFKILIILLYLYYIDEKPIKNGVYNIVVNNSYLYYSENKISLSDDFHYPYTFFRITRLYNNPDDCLYRIEGLLTKNQLIYLNNKELVLNENQNDFQKWNIIETNNKNYILKNSENCYVRIDEFNVICDIISPNDTTKFKLIKLFSEIKEEHSKSDFEILDKEPIDVLIKYIDLRDPNLNREGIHQIEKDFDNEELRYSIRSILNNIPWVRKIYILMPNEKVRYFKDYNLISDKIIYVKDKDFLGYDSSNFNAFLFRYWGMKKFNISDNIIIMDDDYFIGSKLSKSDFFYVKNGKVVPLIITSHFIKLEKDTVQKNRDFYESKAKTTKEEQNGDIFEYVKYLTFSFILETFNVSQNESLYIPKFTHNAIPINLYNIKEVYDLAYISKYKYTTLDCLYRHYEYLQFQMLLQAYTFIKYSKKVKNIPSKFIQMKNSIYENYNTSLFCLNKGAWNYSYLELYRAKIAMEYLFPIPSSYEIIDYSFLNASFNVVSYMDKNIKYYKNKISTMITKEEFFYSFLNLIVLLSLLFLKLYYFHLY